MNSMMTPAAVSLLCIATLASCNDSGGGRVKAVQAAMDASARKPTLAVPDNDYCGQTYAKNVGRLEIYPDIYKGIAQVSVTPIVTTDFMGRANAGISDVISRCGSMCLTPTATEHF